MAALGNSKTASRGIAAECDSSQARAMIERSIPHRDNTLRNQYSVDHIVICECLFSNLCHCHTVNGRRNLQVASFLAAIRCSGITADRSCPVLQQGVCIVTIDGNSRIGSRLQICLCCERRIWANRGKHRNYKQQRDNSPHLFHNFLHNVKRNKILSSMFCAFCNYMVSCLETFFKQL